MAKVGRPSKRAEYEGKWISPLSSRLNGNRVAIKRPLNKIAIQIARRDAMRLNDNHGNNVWSSICLHVFTRMSLKLIVRIIRHENTNYIQGERGKIPEASNRDKKFIVPSAADDEKEWWRCTCNNLENKRLLSLWDLDADGALANRDKTPVEGGKKKLHTEWISLVRVAIYVRKSIRVTNVSRASFIQQFVAKRRERMLRALRRKM